MLEAMGSRFFPDDPSHIQERGEIFQPSLEQADNELRSMIKEIKGAWVERKRLAITVHYREVDEHDVPKLEGLFNIVAQRHPDLKRTTGKKVLELLPNMKWDKGKVVLSLLDRFHVNGPRVNSLYIGDDTTDEDAFRALADQGVTILVSDHPQRTAAQYFLNDISEVKSISENLYRPF